MNSQTILIISTVIGVLLLILALIISILSKKKLKAKTKQISDNQVLKDKQFFKQFKPIQFKKWNKYESGVVISSGKKKFNSINNKFVIKNLEKKSSRKIKKLDYKKLSVCISDKKSSIVVAPPGSGKTQALLLPTILYMINCKEKPNLIITDPKPEINQLMNNELIKNNYNIINLSTKQITNWNNEFETDFWNIFEDIIENHQKLVQSKDNSFDIQEYQSKIITNINKTISYFKEDEKSDYWKDNGLEIIKFLIVYILYKIEINEWNYQHLNIFNLKNNLDNMSTNELNKLIKEIKTSSDLSAKIAIRFTGWSNERAENISSFITNSLKYLDAFNDNYLAMLTSQTTFNLDEIISSNKPFAIFLTINTNSSAHISEKTLLKVWLSIINSKIDYYKQINNNFKNRAIWWLLDECGNIPKLEFLKTIISFGRGRNEFALPIFQSEAQMKQIYGDELIASCENKILFANDNVSLAKNISLLSGLNEQELEYGRTSKNLNLELENITNIPNGYLGLFSFKRNKDNKSFYLAPVTYFYMLKNITKNSKLKSNSKYLLSKYEQIISLDNEETKKLDQTKKFKYWYLNIDSNLVLSSPDKSKCMQLLNQIWIDLEYFRFKEDINIKKLEKINENFTFLQKILNDELSNSLIFKFIWFAKCNRNIIYGKELSEMRYENEQDKTKEN